MRHALIHNFPVSALTTLFHQFTPSLLHFHCLFPISRSWTLCISLSQQRCSTVSFSYKYLWRVSYSALFPILCVWAPLFSFFQFLPPFWASQEESLRLTEEKREVSWWKKDHEIMSPFLVKMCHFQRSQQSLKTRKKWLTSKFPHFCVRKEKREFKIFFPPLSFNPNIVYDHCCLLNLHE